MLAFALTLLTAISAFAAPNVRRREICGSKPSPKEIEEAETDFAKFENVTDSNSLVLNEAYKRGGISFTLIDTDYTTDAEWFDQLGPSNSAVEKEVKERLRQGDQSTLNLYSTGFTQEDELLGQATFPKDYTKNPELDGVMFAYSTLPDGSNVPYNLGHTLIHEVGHWVGLYHTFQGGCKGHGDHVSDT
ncbi:hypothetical protein FRB99_008915 [Tulasnella sp. 403]|nr:hypothetical protein FRB99_008915 [Tulasnella sp. 403]